MLNTLFKQGRLASCFVSSIAIAASLFLGGCKTNFKLIDHVSVVPSDNLEVVRVSLVFANTIQSDLSGGFVIKDYGYLFINPYTPTAPFELGFELNTDIVNDQDFVQLTPTTVLPNGVPTGINYGLVEIHGENPVSSQADVYGYVDVLHGAWLGSAAIFNFINDQYFPNGLSISQVFLRDTAGNAGVIASVFGPSTNGDGSVKQAGGIALFANVKQLLAKTGKQTLYPERTTYLAGPRAAEYHANPVRLLNLGNRVVQGLNQTTKK